ncbi:MAG: hypothetical protein DRN13_03035 [Thermoplasmata archaeon]|nr:MAG: hypothetical protein DRN13_03035 [Thermoplasmata archaeon]
MIAYGLLGLISRVSEKDGENNTVWEGIAPVNRSKVTPEVPGVIYCDTDGAIPWNISDLHNL